MRRSFLRHCFYLAAGISVSAMYPLRALANAYQEVDWDELIPDGWRKQVILEMARMRRFANAADGDPKAEEAYAKLKKTWDAAPIVKSMIGKKVRIPGYVVPLDAERMQSSDFLIVPYFGACVHSPPPPANQIIMIIPPKGTRTKTMDAIWVEGTLGEERTFSDVGTSAYVIRADKVTPYR
jgi:hypothetical protein